MWWQYADLIKGFLSEIVKTNCVNICWSSVSMFIRFSLYCGCGRSCYIHGLFGNGQIYWAHQSWRFYLVFINDEPDNEGQGQCEVNRGQWQSVYPIWSIITCCSSFCGILFHSLLFMKLSLQTLWWCTHCLYPIQKI